MINNGTQLRDKGIKQALDSANDAHEKWSEKAYKFLVNYIKSNKRKSVKQPSFKRFMTEDVRLASEKEIPIPPSNRAWGGIVVKASKAGLISRVGFSNVKNVKAHKTPATVWRVNE